ncbi:rRNA methyltransferase [Desulfuromonas versatilis]|uniref:rRNA methyltransferase n=1 Tax=Desulfuromonas versatilis TaxID=2802975 RepID=A0ABN6E0M2_9BACT|nr:class I SAM-dependent methyltransferase [Desulfuromonas versatilis]BCR05883.1 rRNA methyltransferase [Desulfuromonas versatilis]
MSAAKPLTRIVAWSHELLAEVLEPGQAALDLTAGNGHDTLFLARQSGAGGTVLAFDVQEQALAATAERLRLAGISWRPAAPGPLPGAGVYLAHDSHAHLERYQTGALRAVIANLGYLPGGDPTRVTQPATTLAALAPAARRLAVGGRIAVVVYPGHPGGAEEGRAVAGIFGRLPSAHWQVLRLEVANHPRVPYLLVAAKSRAEAPLGADCPDSNC